MINYDAGSVLVTGRGGRQVSAAFEDTRIATSDDAWQSIVQNATEDLDENIEDIVQVAKRAQGDNENVSKVDDSKEKYGCGFSYIENHLSPSTGDNIEVLWALDNTYYCGGIRQLMMKGIVSLHMMTMTKKLYLFPKKTVACLSTRKNLKKFKRATIKYSGSPKRNDGKAWTKIFSFSPPTRFRSISDETSIWKGKEKIYGKCLKSTAQIRPTRCEHYFESFSIPNKGGRWWVIGIKSPKRPTKERGQWYWKSEDGLLYVPSSRYRSETCSKQSYGWRLIKVDAETAFNQTREAERDVQVIPSK